ncbi:MAG TPA: hypothetical protein VFZ95_01105, partial [Steroidobacteraceae bacterium]
MKRKLSAMAVAAALAYAGSLWAAEATVSQSGADNDAGVTQTQAFDFGGTPTSANVTQNGNENNATVTQDFVAGPSSNVSQTGNNNAAITQHGGAGNSAVVTQN